MVSKFVGDSEKHIRDLFRNAAGTKPCIIFIDEIDSICSNRSDNEQEASRRLKNEFLLRMNEVLDSDGVLVLGATNRPFDLDPAVRRRFEKRVYIPLPDKTAREKLFTIHIGKEPVKLNPSSISKFAQLTEGYSGSDIATIVRETFYIPLRHTMNATHWKQIKSRVHSIPYMMIPCSPKDPSAVQINMMSLEPETVILSDITEDTFIEAIKTTKPSVNLDDLSMYDSFTQMYGTIDYRENTVIEEENTIPIKPQTTNKPQTEHPIPIKPQTSNKPQTEQKRSLFAFFS